MKKFIAVFFAVSIIRIASPIIDTGVPLPKVYPGNFCQVKACRCISYGMPIIGQGEVCQ